MRTTAFHLAAAIAVAQAACGTAADDEGGSGTLAVDAQVAYSPGAWRHLEAAQAADTTVATVEIRRDGEPVEGAEVVLSAHDGGSQVALTGSGGSYRAVAAGYRRDVRLEVRAGSDWLTASLRGPARHTMTEPAAGGVARRQQDLTVRWDSSERGGCSTSTCSLSRSGFAAATCRDSLRCRIPAEELLAGPETVEVRRRVERPLEHGTAGSRLAIDYLFAVPFVVEDGAS